MSSLENDSPNSHLTDDVRNRVESISEDTALQWGGNRHNETTHVRKIFTDDTYTERTVVRSPEDGVKAFRKYTQYFHHVLENHNATSSAAVMLPCGKQKPIGASQIHQKKLHALEKAGYTPEMDITIMSEPCTIIPHNHRLALPAVNYDYPPEYAEKERANTAFNIFTDRLARWLDMCNYDVIYAYLVERHQNKLDAALEKTVTPPEIVEIPGASYNPETRNYSGDLFKTTEDIAMKLQMVRATHSESPLPNDLPQHVIDFYTDLLEE